MIDLDDTISLARLLVATAEGLSNAIDKAKEALESGTAQLKEALVEIEKTRDQLATDRKAADTELDRKFDGSKS